MIENIRYFLKEGFRNFWSNGIMTIASIGVLTVCLLLLGSSLLVSVNVGALISQIEGKNQILVCLKDSADQKAIDNIGSALEKMPNVKNVTFVSRQEAFSNAKKTLGDQDELLSGMENAYPNSYRIEVNKMENYSTTVSMIRKIDGVESVSANSGIANKLTNISRVINLIGAVTFIILGVIALFLIMNTIKVAVFIRRREINIMKFVGATNGFIRWPFVVEGILIGVIGGMIGIVAQREIYELMISRLFVTLNVVPVSYPHLFVYSGTAFVSLGILLGVAGSLLSLRKYLSV